MGRFSFQLNCVLKYTNGITSGRLLQSFICLLLCLVIALVMESVGEMGLFCFSLLGNGRVLLVEVD